MNAVMDWKRWILVLAAWGLAVGVGLAGGATELLFFYDESCTHCKQVESFLTDLQQAGLEFTIERYEIHTPEGWNLLLRLLGVYHADIGSVPMVFVGEIAVVGNTFYGLGPEPIVYTGAAYDLVLEEAVRAAVAANAPSPLTLLPPVATEAVVIVPSDPCLDSGCVLLDLHLTQLGETYPALGIRRLAVTDPNASSTFEKLLRLYGVRGDPPALFVGDAVVVGGTCTSRGAILFLSRARPGGRAPRRGGEGGGSQGDLPSTGCGCGNSSPWEQWSSVQPLTRSTPVTLLFWSSSLGPCSSWGRGSR